MQAHNIYWNDKVSISIQSVTAMSFVGPHMQKKIEEGKRPQYMLFTYGQLHSVTNTKFSMPTGHITFKASRKRKSLVVITLAADDLKVITHV